MKRTLFAWLWQGTKAEAKHPFLATLVAPLFALIPGLPMLIKGGFSEAGGFAIVVALIVSYPTTLLFGLPWFLALSWAGFAGLIPMILGSGLPLLFMYLREPQNAGGLAINALMLGSGACVATAFWIIARSPFSADIRLQKLTPKKLAHGVYAGLVTLFIFLVAGSMLRPDMKSLVAQANELISRAGGPREICDEADRLFKTFKSSDDGKVIFASDVAAYPAVATLLRAHVHGSAGRLSLSDPPVPRIYLRVGSHLDGYTIAIFGSGAFGKVSDVSPGVNIANSCIIIEQ